MAAFVQIHLYNFVTVGSCLPQSPPFLAQIALFPLTQFLSVCPSVCLAFPSLFIPMTSLAVWPRYDSFRNTFSNLWKARYYVHSVAGYVANSTTELCRTYTMSNTVNPHHTEGWKHF